MDNIIHVTNGVSPLHVLGWVRVEYVKISLYFTTGSFNKTICIQKCHSNIDYDKKEFKRSTCIETGTCAPAPTYKGDYIAKYDKAVENGDGDSSEGNIEALVANKSNSQVTI